MCGWVLVPLRRFFWEWDLERSLEFWRTSRLLVRLDYSIFELGDIWLYILIYFHGGARFLNSFDLAQGLLALLRNSLLVYNDDLLNFLLYLVHLCIFLDLRLDVTDPSLWFFCIWLWWCILQVRDASLDRLLLLV